MKKKLSSAKAKEMLKDGTAQGHPLTDKQKRYFGYVAGGGEPQAQTGKKLAPKYVFPSAYSYNMWQPEFNPSHGDSTLYKDTFNKALFNHTNPQPYIDNARSLQMGSHNEYDIENGLNAGRREYLKNMLIANAIEDANTQLPKKKSGGVIKNDLKMFTTANPNNAKMSAPKGWKGAGFSAQAGITIDPMGYWNPENEGKPVIIPSNQITMKGVNHSIMGFSDKGDKKLMKPGKNYHFNGNYVTEYPISGQSTEGVHLKQLVDFSNNNNMEQAKSGIHIKPENKGKFNATKKATGKSTEELTHSKNPVTKKRAIFAQNAAKWHHAQAGFGVMPQALTPEADVSIAGPHIVSPQESGTRAYANFAERKKQQFLATTPPVQAQQYVQNQIQAANTRRPGESIIDYDNRMRTGDFFPAPQQMKAVGSPGIPWTPPKSSVAHNEDITLHGQTGISIPKPDGSDSDINNQFKRDTDQDGFAFRHEMATVNPGTQSYAPSDLSAVTPGKFNLNIRDTTNKPKFYGTNPLIAGLAAVDALLPADQPTRHYDRPEYQNYYNPHPTGTGSQAIAEQGGWVNGNAAPFPYKSGIRFRSGGEIMNVGNLSNPIYRAGGHMRPEYEQTGELQVHEGKAETLSDNFLHSPMVEFKGPSHAEGGMDISYQGTPVEVEGEETGFKDAEGNFQILGNLKNPMTGRLFKNDGKKIAEQENKANRLKTRGINLVNDSNPNDPFEQLSLNVGKIKMQKATTDLARLAQEKEQLAALQQQKLDMAKKLGIEPMKMDGKKATAQMGKMMDQAGKRINFTNPIDNTLKGIDKRKALPYDSRHVHSGFVTPPVERALNMAEYDPKSRGMRIPYTGAVYMGSPVRSGEVPKPSPYLENGNVPVLVMPPDTEGHKNLVGFDTPPIVPFTPPAPTPNPVVNPTVPVVKKTGKKSTGKAVVKGSTEVNLDMNNTPNPYAWNNLENNNAPVSPYTGLPIATVNRPERVPLASDNTVSNMSDPSINVSTDKQMYSDARPANPATYLPEIYALATNRQEPVQMQHYRPELAQAYQYSMQDQLNENENTFRGLQQQLAGNPEALAELSAKKYQADQQIKANEFRTNQGISADVYNQNRQLMNQAAMTNLQLQDQQYERQARAKSNTKATNFNALQSITDKTLQHEANMNNLKVMENLYNYRYGNDFRAKYEGPDAQFTNFLVTQTNPETGKMYTPGEAVEYQRKVKYNNLNPASKNIEETTKQKPSKSKYGMSISRQFKLHKG